MGSWAAPAIGAPVSSRTPVPRLLRNGQVIVDLVMDVPGRRAPRPVMASMSWPRRRATIHRWSISAVMVKAVSAAWYVGRGRAEAFV